MTQIIALLLSIFEAVPILDKWAQQFALAYAQCQKEKSNEDFKKAMALAIDHKDTTALAAELGSKFN